MHPNQQQHGNPNLGGFPQQGQPPQQAPPNMMQQQMNYYPQGNVPMGYQAPGMMQQNAGSAQQPSMMQQAMFGAQGAMTSGQGRSGQQQGYPAGFGPASVNQPQGPVPMGSGGVMGQGQYPQAQSSAANHLQPSAAGPISAQYAGQMPPYSQMGTTSTSSLHPNQMAPTASHQGPANMPQPKTEPKKNLAPPPYSAEILANLDKYSVDALCAIGKEIVHELNLRTSAMCSSLKSQSERKPVGSGQDVETIMEYCLQLFDRLNELRIHLETKYPSKPMKNTDILCRFEDMSDPTEDRPEELQKKYQTFEDNKKRLLSLNSDLKMLDWMATVSDPSQLKKVDKMPELQAKPNFVS